MACRIPTYDCIILFGMCELWNMTIACALRWGVASVGFYSTRRSSPFMGPPFQVQGVHRCTALTRGRSYEESQVVVCIHFCKDVWNKLVLACILCKKNCN